MKGKVAVLAGGRSPEREVSLLSGHRVRNALLATGWDAATVDPAEAPLLETLESGNFDACYIALHGKEGEDGTVQRLLELVDIPYTGTRPFRCQVAFDKALGKEALAAAGVPTPPWAVIQASALRDLSAGNILRHVVDRVGLPLVVKPCQGGSAMGLSFADRESELPAGVMGYWRMSPIHAISGSIRGRRVLAKA